MDRTRRDLPRGTPLTPETGADPAPPKRRAWLLLPIFIFVIARLFSSLAFSSSEDAYTLEVGGGVIEVSVSGHPTGATSAELRGWIENSARGVAAYFGRFPVERARLLVRVGGGQRVTHGRATPGRVPTVRITVGGDADRRALDNDWVLVHELIHLGFPSVHGPHDWMGEGLATYAEPLARLRNGTLAPRRFWSDLVRDLPQGLPERDERGLNATQSWASTYWGGALFWFLADVQIRQATGGRKGLQDVLRAVNRAGGTLNAAWSLEEFLRVADAEAGAPVLRRLYDEWARQRGDVDLSLLWRRLGVVSRGSLRGGVDFDDTASLATVRKSIAGP